MKFGGSAFGTGASSRSGGGGGFSGAVAGSGGAAPDVVGAGKFDIAPQDLSNPIAQVGNVLGSAGDFIGGVAGVVGSIGVPGGPNLGGVAKLPADAVSNALGGVGDVLRAVGGVQLPYLGNDPTRTGATIGDIPGEIGTIVGLPEKAVERTVAGFRAENRWGLSAEDAWKLDNGASVSEVADGMVARNAGFVDNPILNLAGAIVLDPTNLLSFGAGAAIHAAVIGDHAAIAAAHIGTDEKVIEGIMNVAGHAMPKGGAQEVVKMGAEVASGVFDSIGTRDYNAIMGRLGHIGTDAADRVREGLSIGAFQYLPQVSINRIMRETVVEDAAGVIGARVGRDARTLTGETARQVTGTRVIIARKEFRREVETLADRVAPTYLDMSAEEKIAVAADKLSRTAGIELTDAEQLVRELSKGAPDIQFMRTIDLMHYGSAIKGLDQAVLKITPAEAKAANFGRELTLMAHGTLAVDEGTALSKALRSGYEFTNPAGEVRFHRGAPGRRATVGEQQKYLQAKEAGRVAAKDAVDRYEMFADLRSIADPEKLREAMAARLQAYITNGLLPTQVRSAKAGETAAHALPKSIKAFLEGQGEFGYRIGLMPEGEQTIVHVGGEHGTEMVRPFVKAASDVPLLSVKPPMVRAMEAMTRAISYSKIINAAEQRMTTRVVSHGLTEVEGKRFFRAVVNTAQDEGTSVRALPQRGTSSIGYEAIAQAAWGATRVDAFKQGGGDLTALVMEAFAGNLSQVGLSQKISGEFKRALPGLIPEITDGIYPKWRFTLDPIFRQQERVESLILAPLRGVRPVWTKPAEKAVAEDVAYLAQSVIKDAAENGGFATFIDGDAATVAFTAGQSAAKAATGSSSRLGRLVKGVVVPDFKDILSRKNANLYKQVVTEHPEAFHDTILKFYGSHVWKTMTDAYGTTDPAQVVRSFMDERYALMLDDGGTALTELLAKGKLAFGDQLDADMETVWQAYATSLEKVTKQAHATHFFKQDRNIIERSLNHPYLGIYPLSYMAKVGQEFARFMLVRPFGLKAPLAGYNAVARVQRAIIVQQQVDPEGFGKWMESNKDALYFLNIMMPGLPTNLPANAPAIVRHMADAQNAGTDPFARVAKDFPTDALGNIGIGRDVSTLVPALDAVAGDIHGLLDAASNAFDGMFGPKNE